MYRGDLLVAPFVVVGVALLLGAALAIRERPRVGSRVWRWSRRALTAAALVFVVTPISAAVWVTQAPRESVRPFALAHEDVSLRTRDGLRLADATIRSAGTPQPPPLQQLAPEIVPRPVLLIATGRGVERSMNRAYHRAAPGTELWELPQAGHTRGLTEAPRPTSAR